LEKKLTEEELESSDGQEGRPAYVAYKGKVYDVSDSRLWRGGLHVRRHEAGNDLTVDLSAAPHDESVFERVPMVGTLAAVEEEQEEERGVFEKLLDLYFDFHPHPVAVHFPVALGVVSAVFLLLYLVTGVAAFEVSGYFVLWAALVMTPLAMLSGAVSWWFNYGRTLDNRFKIKIGGSVVLLILEVIAVALRTTNPGSVAHRQALGWVYVALIVAVMAHVGILGWVGGQITFPPRRKH
jgi:predicted heme/steroid binding protein/uncharacterized membrane protein